MKYDFLKTVKYFVFEIKYFLMAVLGFVMLNIVVYYFTPFDKDDSTLINIGITVWLSTLISLISVGILGCCFMLYGIFVNFITEAWKNAKHKARKF